MADETSEPHEDQYCVVVPIGVATSSQDIPENAFLEEFVSAFLMEFAWQVWPHCM